MSLNRHPRRANLFLIRIWTQTEDARSEGGAAKAREAAMLRGKVQRVTDGEACQFSDWQGLMDALTAMLSDSVKGER